MDAILPARELFDLTGEVALVTGASSGLGERFARVLTAHGAKVVLAARRIDRLEDLRAEIGDDAAAVPLDVSDIARIAPAFDAAERAFGTVTLLVNNAGTAAPGRFLETSEDDWQRTRAVNLDGAWHVAQEAAQRMAKAQTGGAIINIASVLGYRVTPGNAAYAVTKAAVLHMTGALALELARHRIRVNGLAPGYIATEMTEEFLNSPAADATKRAIPQRRIGAPSDLDGPLLLLASKKASGFMTGATIVADGGHMWSFV